MGSLPAPELLLMNELNCSAEAWEQPLPGQYLWFLEISSIMF